MKKLIKNGLVFNSDGSGFTQRDVYVQDDRFVDAFESADEVIDANGAYVLPGMIDIHTHGAFGVCFADDEDFTAARKWFAERGVTGFLPTVSTFPLPKIVEMERRMAAKAERVEGQSSILGIHLEGPFISPIKCGAMVVCDDACSVENLHTLLNAGQGKVKMMTIAPEHENAEEVIKEGVRLGVRMSIGHTNATYEEAKRGADWGCRGATHLYNAMRAFEHRETGVLGEVLTDERVSCEIIADFVHVDPIAVLTAYRLKGKDKLILISDSSTATGRADGVYYEYGRPFYVKNGVSRTAAGNLTCSMLSVYDDAKNMLTLGIPLHEVACMASATPAKEIGVFDEYGSIEAGKYADFLLCDEKLTLQGVFIGGKEVAAKA